VQVLRRLRSALFGVTESVKSMTQLESVQRYLQHLDSLIERSPFDVEDRVVARQEDPQGIGLSRKRTGHKTMMGVT
jgi:hypothetical protein